MGLAVPSLAEASRGLRSVKANEPSADHDLVTSVALSPPAVDEPVSPELALVDPELAARLRALLPEIEPQIPLYPEPPVLRVLRAPGAEDVPPLAAPTPLGQVTTVPATTAPASSRSEQLWSLTKAFLAGAAVATVVTVGVIAEMDEGAPAQADEALTVPPTSAPAAPGVAGKGAAPKTPRIAQPGRDSGVSQPSGGAAAKQKRTAARKQRAAVKQGAAAKPRAASKQSPQSKQSTAKQSSGATQTPPSTQAPKQSPAQKPATKAKQEPKPAAAPPETRRFAWAPVEGAVGYRVELFRGTRQVLEVRTESPAYELVSPWRHAGRAERLTRGSYRWYVWPVFTSGTAAQAVVQATLSIP